NSAKTRETLDRVKKVYQSLDEGYEFQGFPSSRKQGASVGSILLTQSAFSKDLRDFETRTVGVMPMAAHRELFVALRALEPEYDRHIWQPSLKKLEGKRKRL